MFNQTLRSILTTLLFLCSLSTSANELDLSLFTTQKINNNLYVFSQDYGDPSINFAAIIGDTHVALITTMMKEFSPHVDALIKKITNKPIKYVISIDGDNYQYYGSRYFVENGATFVAHRNLIPDVFKNRILVDKPYSINLGTEQLRAIPTKAHTIDHMMVILEKSNVIFVGDAISFDWIVYSGPNGPDAHIIALKNMLALGNEKTRYYPGNWINKDFGYKKEMNALLTTYSQFVEQVQVLYQAGKRPEEIAENKQIHNLLKPLKDYDRQKQYLIHYVRDVLGLGNES